MTAGIEVASRRVRAAALLLIVGLAGWPGRHACLLDAGRHLGAPTRTTTSTGMRVVAGVVVVLLIAAVLVVLARVGLWQQAFVSARVIRFFAWALAAIFLVETLAAFTWSRGEYEWWLYGPVSLVLAVLALVVAGSGGSWPRFHRPHRTLLSH